MLFPNPTSSEINIKSDKSIFQLRIYDSYGKLIIKSGQTQNINIEKFPQGIYTFELKFTDGSFSTKKIIKY